MQNTRLKLFFDGFSGEIQRQNKYKPLGAITLAIRQKQIKSYKEINQIHLAKRFKLGTK
ncbi:MULTISPECIES: hypothetical protein [unclassified Helicobacter]|uniref:hypothetical protein n=1 Tax=unclassified Helicobacter TaxID=2593540 RepID=UPI0015F1B3C3|nr:MULTISPECIES: hypothetical protein [unclassified Helicobacter]